MNHEQKKFWNWKSISNNTEENNVRVLVLEGPIDSESFWGDEVTPKMFKDELNAGTGDIEVYINSPGGDCIAASQIYTMLMEYKGHVTVKVNGIAASAASVIAMAGENVLMAPTALLMIHNPMTIAMGNRDDMKQAIAVLDEVKESIMNAYEIKSGLSREKISHLMDSETWMNARKAVELGFADGIIGQDDKTSEATTDSMPAYDFSSHLMEQRIANQLIEKSKSLEEDKAAPETTDNKAVKPEQEAEKMEPAKFGRTFNELMGRLSLLKN